MRTRREEPSRGTNELSQAALRPLCSRVERILRSSLGKKCRRREEERERESKKGERRGTRGGLGAPTQFLLFWYPTWDSGGGDRPTMTGPGRRRSAAMGPSRARYPRRPSRIPGGSYGHWSRPSRAERARLPTKANLPNPNLRQRGFALPLPFPLAPRLPRFLHTCTSILLPFLLLSPAPLTFLTERPLSLNTLWFSLFPASPSPPPHHVFREGPRGPRWRMKGPRGMSRE